MPRNYDEELIKGALKIYEEMKSSFDPDRYERLVEELCEKIDKTPLSKLFEITDSNYILGELMVDSKSSEVSRLRELSVDELTEKIKSSLLRIKVLDYYVPIYLLYELPKELTVGFSTIVEFHDLPENVQKSYVKTWKQQFETYADFSSLEDSIKAKSESVFLHFSLKVNGRNKAKKNSQQIAQDALTIIGFACGGHNFSLMDFFYTVDGSEEVYSQLDGRYDLPIEGIISSEKIIQRIKILSSIFVNCNPNEIELKIKNALRIYRLQQPVVYNQVRFLLLMTCFESLLMTKSDRDYILWRLAEKVTFILGETVQDRSMQEINSLIKDAYTKRSAFVHGSTDTKETIALSDTIRLDIFFSKLVWTIINNFLKQGYTQIQKAKDKKSIDEYIEQRKFGKQPGVRKESGI